MEKNPKYPDLFTIKGEGIISSTEIEIKTEFEITRYPQNTIIEAQTDDPNIVLKLIGLERESWNLKGITENGIKVNAANLLRTKASGNEITFYSFKDLCFGEQDLEHISFAEFPLVGIYDTSFHIQNNNWEIECEGEDTNKLKSSKRKSQNWGLQLEGNTLKLKNKDAKIEQYLKKADDITSLLSLASGNDVVFNRQLYYTNDTLSLERWKRKVDYYFGAEKCIPDSQLDSYIESTIENYENWDEKKKILFFSTVNYINSSSKGYIENRLLGICIAWESIAQKWAPKKPKTSDELANFKKLLKEAINDFELPPKYDKQSITDRIIKSLDWEKSAIQLKDLAEKYDLDQEKLGLDFKSLIRIRNDIAHSGLFRKKYDLDFLMELLYHHKFGLQVLLLLELGYGGLVESQENNNRTFVAISQLQKNKTN